LAGLSSASGLVLVYCFLVWPISPLLTALAGLSSASGLVLVHYFLVWSISPLLLVWS
jgi:hypothetical protein